MSFDNKILTEKIKKMKKQNFDEEVRREALRLWLDAHKREARIRARIILLALALALTAVIIFLVAPYNFGGLADYRIVAIIASAIGSFFLIVPGFISTLDPISPTSWVVRPYNQRSRVMITQVLVNLRDAYEKEAKRWLPDGDLLHNYLALEEDFRRMINRMPNLNNPEKKSDTEKTWEILALAKLTEINDFLQTNLEDNFFTAPKQIAALPKQISTLICEVRNDYFKDFFGTSEDATYYLSEKTDELTKLVKRIPDFLQNRKLTYGGSRII